MNTAECFRHYEKLMDEKSMNLPSRDFSGNSTAKEVSELVKKSLGFDEKLLPGLKVQTIRTIRKSSFQIQLLEAETWPGVSAAANLYVPERALSGQKCPLIVVCCGHAGNGRLDTAYQTMAAMLAASGAVALIADNIGQGERVPMGHFDCPGVFACGLSLQGLIVMETVGWLRWAMKLPYVDSSRIGATGNSGGGALTLFLCALFPELLAACPTGYPSTFNFVARKEKRHCDCNVIPACLGKYEMWDVLGCFSPKPLLIVQGANDNMFPEDVFFHTARKVREIYVRTGAGDNFDAVSLPGLHSWDAGRLELIAGFFRKTFGLDSSSQITGNDVLTVDEGAVFPQWPAEALTAEQLACALTGKEYPSGISFEDVFKPKFEPEEKESCLFRKVTARRLLAQFEAFSS